MHVYIYIYAYDIGCCLWMNLLCWSQRQTQLTTVFYRGGNCLICRDVLGLWGKYALLSQRPVGHSNSNCQDFGGSSTTVTTNEASSCVHSESHDTVYQRTAAHSPMFFSPISIDLPVCR